MAVTGHPGEVLGRRRKRERPQPAEVYGDLRTMALRAVAEGLAPPSSEHPDVSGVVLDIPAQDAYATVVALTDNTTSMYTSVGGGTIGAGEHPQVAEATRRLLSVVQDHLGAFVRHDDGSLPLAGHVRYHLLTPSGNRYVDVPEDGFWGRAEHELIPVIAASQELLSAIREVTSP